MMAKGKIEDSRDETRDRRHNNNSSNERIVESRESRAV